MTRKIMNIPESFFSNLKDYHFESHYMDLGGLNMHYLDEGDKNGNPPFYFTINIPGVTSTGI